MNGAGTALTDPAAVLGTGQTDVITDGPEKGHVRVQGELVLGAVDAQLDHGRLQILQGN
jgi:hypothetical protein